MKSILRKLWALLFGKAKEKLPDVLVIKPPAHPADAVVLKAEADEFIGKQFDVKSNNVSIAVEPK